MEEFRQTNQLELHVNQEIQAELMREHLSKTIQSQTHVLYQFCTNECLKDANPLSTAEKTCLTRCHGRFNTAYRAHLHSLIASPL